MQTKEEIMELGFNEIEAEAFGLMNMGIALFNDCMIDNDCVVDLEDSDCCKLKLTLKNAAAIIPFDEEDGGYYYFSDGRIEKNKHGYLINDDKGAKIGFDSVEIFSKSKRAKIYIIDECPWRALSLFALSINEKVKSIFCEVNEKELALEPLLDELCCLFDYGIVNLNDLPILKSMLPYDKKIYELIDKIICCENEIKRLRLFNKLDLRLSDKKFEQSFRNILSLLEDSQAEYPEERITEPRRRVRELITQRMQANGFEGEYPLFKKQTKIKGVKLAYSKGEIYCVCGDDATIFIECENHFADGYGTVLFKASTCLARHSDEIDKYSYLFAKKGKGYYNESIMSYEIDVLNNLSIGSYNELKPDIICKKSEFTRLSKEERKASGDAMTFSEFVLTMWIWLGIGLFLGAFMVIGFMLLGIIICLVFGMASEIPSLFRDFPWWKMFLFGWLVFSGLMGIITIFAKGR